MVYEKQLKLRIFAQSEKEKIEREKELQAKLKQQQNKGIKVKRMINLQSFDCFELGCDATTAVVLSYETLLPQIESEMLPKAMLPRKIILLEV